MHADNLGRIFQIKRGLKFRGSRGIEPSLPFNTPHHQLVKITIIEVTIVKRALEFDRVCYITFYTFDLDFSQIFFQYSLGQEIWGYSSTTPMLLMSEGKWTGISH